MEATIETALAMAAVAHRGQTDKAGEPYILHILRVVLAVDGHDERIAAALHDIVEDTPTTLPMLIDAGVSPRVVSAVDALSRRSGETYGDFIRRCRADPIGRAVKLADLQDNLCVQRLPRITPEDEKRTRRYFDAVAILSDETPHDPR